jgi:large subunit ribosomal protein L28
MSRICQITGKKVMVGNNVSHANNKNKRKFYPNLQTKKFYIPETGETIILKVSAKALRTINKKGIAAVLSEARANGNVLV